MENVVIRKWLRWVERVIRWVLKCDGIAMEYRTGTIREGNIKAGMFVYALAFLLGVIIAQQLAVLPTPQQLIVLLLGYVVLLILIAYLIRRYHTFLNNSVQFKSAGEQTSNNRQYTLIICLILLIIIGILYAIAYASQQLSYRLNEDFVGQNLLVKGTVVGIPVPGENTQRFEFDVEQLNIIGADNIYVDSIDADNKTIQHPNASGLSSTGSFPNKIRLSWYYGKPVSAGERWQFEVRLKPPHGFQNPGGFDYEGWLFQHGIQATGYVRRSALNNKQSMSFDGVFLPVLDWLNIDSIRQKLGDRIDEVARQPTDEKLKSFALVKALAIGDKSAISKQQWQVLSATGTSHLMAISGLHIGLAALFAYVLIRRLVPVSISKIFPAQHVALIGGVIVALMYALVAGLSVPTQRAFIMLFILSMMMLIRRNHRPVDALGFALIIVLLIDPLAVLSAGFWFSFSAVAVIFISVDSYSTEVNTQKNTSLEHTWQKVLFILKKWIRLQLLISLFLLPLSLFMFQQVSLVSPLANLLLIPYVSFFVVPLVLLALCVTFFSPVLAGYLFFSAASLLDFIWPMLMYLSEQPYALWIKGDVGIVQLLMATAGIILLYFWWLSFNRSHVRSITIDRKGKLFQPVPDLSILLIAIALFLSAYSGNSSILQESEYKVIVLDVGQGSAAVVQTKNHVLVFDTGVKYSERFDVGSSVVVPYLRSQGIHSIDRLIISHGDADHIGGAIAVLNAFPSAAVLGRDIDNLQSDNKQLCVAGLKWQWDGVNFGFLSPLVPDPADLGQVDSGQIGQGQAMDEPANDDQMKAVMKNREIVNSVQNIPVTGKRNNQSCVLKVSSLAGSTLFTGDIEKIVEQQLVSKSSAQLKSDVLIVPHHGSKTSSSLDFINTVGAEISIFSVGYKNRYKLPNKRVLSRYQASDSTVLRTDKSGAITLTFLTDENTRLEKYRELTKRYWHHSME